MAPRASQREHRAPRNRVAKEGYFFPNEVVRILRLERVDYRQLRRLFQLVRDASGSTSPRKGSWARYSFQDIAALRVAIDLAGGTDALRANRRLRLKPIALACKELREKYGLTSPLTQARLHREGRTIVADLGGLHFVPQSGQMVFGSLRGNIKNHLQRFDAKRVRGQVNARIQREEEHLRGVRTQRAERCLTSPSALVAIRIGTQ